MTMFHPHHCMLISALKMRVRVEWRLKAVRKFQDTAAMSLLSASLNAQTYLLPFKPLNTVPLFTQEW